MLTEQVYGCRVPYSHERRATAAQFRIAARKAAAAASARTGACRSSRVPSTSRAAACVIAGLEETQHVLEPCEARRPQLIRQVHERHLDAERLDAVGGPATDKVVSVRADPATQEPVALGLGQPERQVAVGPDVFELGDGQREAGPVADREKAEGVVVRDAASTLPRA